MVKTAEFRQPTDRAPAPGRCRICRCHSEPADMRVPPFVKDVPCDSWLCLITEGPTEGRLSRRTCKWADETETLCDNPKCIAAARAEISPRPLDAERLMRPQSGPRYGFAPRRGR